MNGCEQVREILVSVARGERMSAPDDGLLRGHLGACAECRRRLANERMLSAGLSGVASSAAVPPVEVRHALMAEFRRQRVVVQIRPQPVRTTFRWVAMGALAAAVLLAVFMARGRRPETAAATVRAPVPMVAQRPVEKTVTGQAKARSTSLPTRRRRVPPPAPVEEAPEVATDFIGIPYAEPLRPEERADVFRIQVPRARMAAFGLPVPGGRLDSRITADVLTGEDGVVRAVRFVH